MVQYYGHAVNSFLWLGVTLSTKNIHTYVRLEHILKEQEGWATRPLADVGLCGGLEEA